MNENQGRQVNLVETTDCLEAVGVCRGWKNFLFVIVALCLLLLQASFWLVDTGYVKVDGCAENGSNAGNRRHKSARRRHKPANRGRGAGATTTNQLAALHEIRVFGEDHPIC